MAARAFDEWVQYSNELYLAKKAVIDSGSASKEVVGGTNDLMGKNPVDRTCDRCILIVCTLGALIKASEKESKGSTGLTYDEIIGNTFVGAYRTEGAISFRILQSQ
jgi:hypothetical protein